MVFNNDGPDESTPIDDSFNGFTDPWDEDQSFEEWTPLEEIEGWDESDVNHLEQEAESEGKFSCDHDPNKREFVVIPHSGGVSLMGAGLQAGGGVVKHGCTVCGELHEVNQNRGQNHGPGFLGQ